MPIGDVERKVSVLQGFTNGNYVSVLHCRSYSILTASLGCAKLHKYTMQLMPDQFRVSKLIPIVLDWAYPIAQTM